MAGTGAVAAPGFSAVCCRCQRAFFTGGVLDGSGDMRGRLERRYRTSDQVSGVGGNGGRKY